MRVLFFFHACVRAVQRKSNAAQCIICESHSLGNNHEVDEASLDRIVFWLNSYDSLDNCSEATFLN